MVFTSSTSTFGRALSPAPGRPAAWITEDVTPAVRNIYGATKLAAGAKGYHAAPTGVYTRPASRRVTGAR